MAGRVAEILLLGKTTTGGANDFEKATEIARKMVCQWGMSDLGPLTFGERDDLIFLGRDLAVNKNFSERTSELIDVEVKKIINQNYSRAQELLEKNKRKLLKIAKALLEKEVLDSDEIDKLAGVKKGVAARKAAEEKKKKPAAAPVEEKKEEKKETQEIKPLDKPNLVKA
jgi:cell division protease FtsH